MLGLSLMGKIRKFVLSAGSVRPFTEEDVKLFESIMYDDLGVFNYEPLNLFEVRELAVRIKVEEIVACLWLYKALAEEMGVTCINIDENSKGEIYKALNIKVKQAVTEDVNLVENSGAYNAMLSKIVEYVDNSILSETKDELKKMMKELQQEFINEYSHTTDT